MIPERGLSVTPSGVGTREGTFATDVLVNLPALEPFMASQKLLSLFKEGKVRCLIPPKRFLGNKGLLALISNGDDDLELEKILKAIFSEQTLFALRRFIPRSVIICHRSEKFVLQEMQNNPDRWVIKETMSSGMKGVALGGDRQQLLLKRALFHKYNFIMQEKVPQETREFRFAEPTNPSEIKSAKMFMRVSPFASKVGIATVGVTARETPSVHGSKDSIQIPVVFKG